MGELPSSSQEEVKQRKDCKWVPYDELAQIPEKIRQDANTFVALDDRRKALMMRDALLIAWLTVLPWRQRNLRECRVMPTADGGNLFHEEIPPHSPISKPKWAEEAFRANPRQRFWQFYFRAPETKTARGVRGILPRQLVPVLEEYLGRYRQILLDGRPDPMTLFLSNRGYSLCASGFGRLVESITLKYAGRRVNPHLMRDIFTVQYLQERPEDVLTASKALWHKNIQTTLGVYGVGFDESHAARRIGEWLEQRRESGSSDSTKDSTPRNQSPGNPGSGREP